MIYRILQRSDPEIGVYSQFIRTHTHCHFLQDPAWAEVKPLWKWCAVAVYDDLGQIQGAMSVLLRRLPMGRHLAYAPRGPVCDRTDGQILKLLNLGLKQIGEKNKCLLTYLDPDEPEDQQTFRQIMLAQGFQERHSDAFGGVQPQSVFRLNLNGVGEEALLASFAQKTRYNIRLSQRRGVNVRAYSGAEQIPAEALDHFAALMQTTGQRDHFRVRDRAYFETLLSSLGKDAVLYLATLNEHPIAGTLAIYYGNKAWYLYGASANESREAMPNYLLQWTMLREALKRGCGTFDFRGVPGTGQPDDPLYGLYRFKKGFGGTHTRFTGLFVYDHCAGLGRIFDWALSGFRRLRKTRC